MRLTPSVKRIDRIIMKIHRVSKTMIVTSVGALFIVTVLNVVE